MLLKWCIKYFLIAIIIVISTTLVSERAAFADTVNWTGAGDGINWSDHNNWSTGMVPATSDTIIISPTSVHSVHLNVNFTLSSGGTITINPFNQLLVDPGHILLNFGSITVNAYTGGNLATLYIYKGGTVTNYGTITDKYLFNNFGTINNHGSIF